MRLMTAAARTAAREAFIAGLKARPILEHTNGSSLYVYEVAGAFYAFAFWGTAGRPLWHYRYKTEAARDAAIAKFKASVEATVASKAARRAERKARTNPLKVGDLLYTSWGYDQTNVEFYAVTKVSGKRVWVREIAADYEETGFMSGKTWPAMPIRFVGPETMHTVGDGGLVKISASAYARLLDGEAKHTSSYA